MAAGYSVGSGYTVAPTGGVTAGGVGPRRRKKKGGSGPQSQPPLFSYDPSIEAQRRATWRGLHDTIQDVRTERRQGRTDLREALRKNRRDYGRARQDIGIDFRRGQQRIGFQRSDANLKAGRSQQDLRFRLQSIGRQFAQLGERQGETANSQGTADAGTLAASAAARSQNQAFAEQPVRTAQERVGQDLARALRRLDVAGSQLSQDRNIHLRRTRQDQRFDTQQALQERRRSLLDLKRTAQRARREAAISNVDLLTQEVYGALTQHPGAFAGLKKRYKRRYDQGRH